MQQGRTKKSYIADLLLDGSKSLQFTFGFMYFFFFLKAFTDNATALHTRICKKGRQRNLVTFVLQHIKLLLRQRLRTTKIMSKSLNLFAYTTASEINKINTDIILVFFRTEF